MSARAAGLVAFGFAALWLWIGVAALSMPVRAIVAVLAALAWLIIGWRALQRRSTDRSGVFDRRRYVISVAAEIVALIIVVQWVNRTGHPELMWPVVGVVVGAHFVGLFWASGRRAFLAIAGGMVAVNLAALAFGPDAGAVQAISGLGSGAALLGGLIV